MCDAARNLAGLLNTPRAAQSRVPARLMIAERTLDSSARRACRASSLPPRFVMIVPGDSSTHQWEPTEKSHLTFTAVTVRGVRRADIQSQDSTSAVRADSRWRETRDGKERGRRYSSTKVNAFGSTPGQNRAARWETLAPRGFLGNPSNNTSPSGLVTVPATSSATVLPGAAGRGGDMKVKGEEKPIDTFGSVLVNCARGCDGGAKADKRTPVPPISGDSTSIPAPHFDLRVASITLALHANETTSNAAGAGSDKQISGATLLEDANNLVRDSGSSPDHRAPRGRRDGPEEKNRAGVSMELGILRLGTASLRPSTRKAPDWVSRQTPVEVGVGEKTDPSDDHAGPDRQASIGGRGAEGEVTPDK